MTSIKKHEENSVGRRVTLRVTLRVVRRVTRRVGLLTFAALLMAFNLNTFVKAAGLIPGGFTGLSLLLIGVVNRFTGITLPFSITSYIVNLIPVYIGFRYIGKWFTLYSCLMVVLSGIFTDIMPTLFLQYLSLHDNMLSAVFGGLLNGVVIALCLFADATSGGTDFIAIYLCEKRGRDAWNYILAANCVMFVGAALLWTPMAALYSIIFQYVSTQATTALYKGYQQKTLLIITKESEAVFELIRDKTNHDATSFTGIGRYEKAERVMLYSVVSAGDVHSLVKEIRKIDPGAFINVLRTEQINGRFYRRERK